MKTKKSPFTMISGFVQTRNHPLVLFQYDELLEHGAEDTDVGRLDRTTGQWASFELEWSATRLWAAKTLFPIVATGPAGRVAVKARSGVPHDEEVIFAGARGPEGLGDIRDLRLIGKHLYATGMNRQVYRRNPTAG